MANECVPFYEPGDAITGCPTTAVVGCRFVGISAARITAAGATKGLISIAPATAAGRVFGVAGRDAAVGVPVKVFRKRGTVVPVQASNATITAFAEVESSARRQRGMVKAQGQRRRRRLRRRRLRSQRPRAGLPLLSPGGLTCLPPTPTRALPARVPDGLRHQLTVDLALQQPTRITRRIADITLERFIATRIFAQGGPVSGGAVVFDQAVLNELYLTRDVEQRAPGDEYPVVTSSVSPPASRSSRTGAGSSTSPTSSATATTRPVQQQGDPARQHDRPQGQHPRHRHARGGHHRTVRRDHVRGAELELRRHRRHQRVERHRPTRRPTSRRRSSPPTPTSSACSTTSGWSTRRRCTSST
jgi:hypothetical protein